MVTLALSGAVLGDTASGAIVAIVSLSGEVIGVSRWVLSGTISLPGVVILVLSGTPLLSKVIREFLLLSAILSCRGRSPRLVLLTWFLVASA